MNLHFLRALLACAVPLSCPLLLPAQCSTAWIPMSAGTGLNGFAHASVWVDLTTKQARIEWR